MKTRQSLIYLAFLVCVTVMSSCASRSETTKNADVMPDLPPEYVAVHGTVVTLDGKPVESASGRTLDASGNQGPSWASGKGGKFRTFLKPGTYKLWTIGAKFKAVTLIVPKGRSAISIKVISKLTRDKAAIKFMRSDGVPASNTRIYYREKTSMSMRAYRPVTTDANGMIMWRLEDDAPIGFTFSALDTGYAKLDITDDETLFNTETFAVRFSSDAVSTASRYISGRVISESDGAPLGGIVFYPTRIYKENDPWNMWYGQFNDFPSAGAEFTIRDAMATSRDSDGVFKIGPLPSGDYQVMFGTPELGDPPRDAKIVRGSVLVSVPKDRDIKGLKIIYPLNEPAYSLRGRVYQGNVSPPLTSTVITVSVMTAYPPDQELEHWYV